MSRTSIPVDAATKERLDRLKRDVETWDEFLRRVTATAAGESMEAGVWSDETAERAREAIRESRENWR
ncbi:antitoxin VapB family protein [Haloglomus halophilum]|uniref:antitoxin VapB family protein n=1 Tax=Haloglomus halophilum TaxID=2962672 RepID=UPI0020C98B95|nr:antitoxin VapB family protein [Haloglomus halophilum]